MTARFMRPGFLAVLVALFGAEGAVAQDPAAGPPGDATNEGIAVHGHWTITVVREGEVVETREFENALTSGGQFHLAAVLAGLLTQGPWSIFISADGSDTVCGPSLGLQVEGCFLPSSDVTVSGTGGQLVLEGSAVALRDANLLQVWTRAKTCNPTVSPADCPPGDPATLTQADLDPTIPVQSGDLIEVTVVLSFS